MLKTAKRLSMARSLAVLLGLAACFGTPAGFSDPPAPESNAAAKPVEKAHPIAQREEFDWRDAVIYQIVTDRFADGDAATNAAVDRENPGRYHGGDFRGIEDRIGYLQALGITAVWLSPVIVNVDDHMGAAGYHGYWPQDFSRVNPHFGDLAGLKRLVEKLHAAGIRVIADVVVNHIGQLFYYDVNNDGEPGQIAIDTTGQGAGSEWAPPYDPQGIRLQENGDVTRYPAPIVWLNDRAANRIAPGPAPFRHPDFYSRRGEIYDWNNRDQVLYGDFPGGLKDLRTWDRDVRNALIEVYRQWLRDVPFDGMRIDSVKHVDLYFFTEFCREMRLEVPEKKFIIVGEGFDHDDDLLGQYTRRNMLDSLLNFGQKTKVIDPVIKHGHATAAAEQHLMRTRIGAYSHSPQPNGIGIAPANALVNFIDNHDVPRFVHGLPEAEKLPRLNLALAYAFCVPGIPCIYYGTEHGFDGGADPANREDLWPTNFATDGPYFALVRRWIDIRHREAALRHGDCRVRWSTPRTVDETDAGLLAIERGASVRVDDSRPVLVVLNVKPRGENPRPSRTEFDGHPMTVGFAKGTVLRDLLDEDYRVTVGRAPRNAGPFDHGTVVVEVPATGVRVLVPESPGGDDGD